ncbi:phospholipase D family protein [Zavarzinia sp. CC-PAN008]|uniref:phospholipase D family protein n=1 Tax=Zavarzinia sp. CC-PAN008 TaxID=3243332 RepID=UPI003F7442C8
MSRAARLVLLPHPRKAQARRDGAGLGRDVAAGTAVSLVSDNLEAFALRALSAREATATLDLQYYTWGEDVTGRLLAREVLCAADRGVKVRLLLDDLYVRDASLELSTLAQHPNIQVRLYNPFKIRNWGLLGRTANLLFSSYRLNHRMHNKAWIVDGHVAIAGGRNIGDEYFDASSQFNFRDLDMVLSGAAVPHAVSLFERYWSSRRVHPFENIGEASAMASGLEGLRRRLDAFAEEAVARSYLDRVRDYSALEELLRKGRTELPAGAVRVVADPPDKGRPGLRKPGILNVLRAAMASAEKEVVLISPYFVPGRKGSRLLVRLARRGVKVSVLTNSLAATDVLAVHGGYARYRRRLLRAGIAMYELKRGGQEGTSLFGSSGQASLHTKALFMDDDLVFVGSFNLDPRSANLNTEMGTFARHPELVRQLRAEFARLTDRSRSWTVQLENRRLVWRDDTGRDWHGEPETPFLRRAMARILGWLPLEPQL